MLRIQHGCRRARGFTLVELLVVVSIIALLIAILLPSLKKARENAKRIKCNTNLRSLAQAGLTYAVDDPNELGIPSGIGDQTREAYPAYIGFGGKSGYGLTLYKGQPVDQSPFAGGDQYKMGAPHRPLNRVLYKGEVGGAVSLSSRTGSTEDWTRDAKLNLDLFHCPGDRQFPGMHHNGWKMSGLSAYDYYGTSYSSNPYLIGWAEEGAPLSSNSVYMRPLSRVPSPTATVLYSEYAMRFAVFASNTEEYDQSNGCWPFFGVTGQTAYGFHDKAWWFNLSFGDGHTDWVKIKGYGAPHGVKLSPTSCKNMSCVCLVQRGRGWQIDTMPAELIPTHKIRTGRNDTLIAVGDGESGGLGMWDCVGR